MEMIRWRDTMRPLRMCGISNYCGCGHDLGGSLLLAKNKARHKLFCQSKRSLYFYAGLIEAFLEILFTSQILWKGLSGIFDIS